MNTHQQHNSDSQIQYHKLDLVWAKITGYPWWPGKITTCPTHKQPNYKVQFIGDHSYAFVSDKKLMKYEQWRDKYSTLKKGSRTYQKAVAEAEQIYFTTKEERNKQEDSQIEEEQSNQGILELCAQSKQQELHPSSTNQKYQNFYDSHENKLSQSLKKQNNKTMGKQTEIGIHHLLFQYGLHNIPKYKVVQECGKKNKSIKKMRKEKFRQKGQSKAIKSLLLKKINRILKARQIDLYERKQILGYFSEEISSDNLAEGFGKYKHLFHWFSCNEKETIVNQYVQWQKSEVDRSTRQL